ncbi:hypothetical protein [Mycobacterium avium]|uniref:hypothetical protein n=1 Tax=Mycobacterium avium TaxID=1764 RepID=UPI0009FD3780|nr:hypothetical protein [Mycobacterium avium]
MFKRILRRKVESYRDLGWEDLGPWEPGDEFYRGVSCPECGQQYVTSVLQTWENVETDDHHYVDLFWCGNKHMWTVTDSKHETMMR